MEANKKHKKIEEHDKIKKINKKNYILCDKDYIKRHRVKINLNGYWYEEGY